MMPPISLSGGTAGPATSGNIGAVSISTGQSGFTKTASEDKTLMLLALAAAAAAVYLLKK